MFSMVCAAARGAGLGTPIEGPVPQKSCLLWLALGHPSSAAASVTLRYVVMCGGVCVWAHLSYRSLTCGAGEALSQPLTLQHLHLMCPWSSSALLQAGAEDQEGCCGPTLHLECLTALRPMSIVWPQVNMYLTLTQPGCPLPGTQADAWRLMLSSEALFIFHKAFRGARTSARHFIYTLYCY